MERNASEEATRCRDVSSRCCLSIPPVQSRLFSRPSRDDTSEIRTCLEEPPNPRLVSRGRGLRHRSIHAPGGNIVPVSRCLAFSFTSRFAICFVCCRQLSAKYIPYLKQTIEISEPAACYPLPLCNVGSFRKSFLPRCLLS